MKHVEIAKAPGKLRKPRFLLGMRASCPHFSTRCGRAARVPRRFLELALIIIFTLLPGISGEALAAVGCDLNDPDRDVKRLFPASTGYKTAYLSISKSGGEATLKQVEERLGDKFSGIYETMDVPYTVYTIFKGRETIGYIHGINQKGQYGGLQVFLAFDATGKISDFYYQKLTSKDAAAMRTSEFAAQFKGLSMRDFASYNPLTNDGIPGVIKQREDGDFFATLRAVKKNLILMDIFIFSQTPKTPGNAGGSPA